MPHASAKKKAYDTKYESTPERKDYRKKLARARRKAGIMGKGGPDMGHAGSWKTDKVRKESRHGNRSKGGKVGGSR